MAALGRFFGLVSVERDLKNGGAREVSLKKLRGLLPKARSHREMDYYVKDVRSEQNVPHRGEQLDVRLVFVEREEH